MNPELWRGRRVFVTGHTGFKGGWLVTWLRRLGAAVTGYALAPETMPNLFEAARVGDGIRAITGDVRDAEALGAALFAGGTPAVVRNPDAIRPWQHVLEPVHGYLMLAGALLAGDGPADAWNFGPNDAGVRPVRWVADALASRWGEGARWTEDATTHPPEAISLPGEARETTLRQIARYEGSVR